MLPYGLISDPTPFLTCDAEDLTIEQINILLEQYRIMASIVYAKDLESNNNEIVILEPIEVPTLDSSLQITEIYQPRDKSQPKWGKTSPTFTRHANNREDPNSSPSSWKKSEIRPSQLSRTPSQFLYSKSGTQIQRKKKKLPEKKITEKIEVIEEEVIEDEETETNLASFEAIFSKLETPLNHIVPATPILRVGWCLVRKKNYVGLAPLKQWTPRWIVLVCYNLGAFDDTNALLRIFENHESIDAKKQYDVSLFRNIFIFRHVPGYPSYCVSIVMESKTVTFGFGKEDDGVRWLKSIALVSPILPKKMEPDANS